MATTFENNSAPPDNLQDNTMFGKTKDFIEDSTDTAADFDAPDTDVPNAISEFFGDEAGVERDAQMATVQERITQVEGQINSQFTSLAAYAQISQEQVELVRAEAKAQSERTESRVTQLIERERNDRLANRGSGATAGTGVSTDIEGRLDQLERSIASVISGLNDCLNRQKALADAITALFEPKETATLPPPVADGPIGDLAMNG